MSQWRIATKQWTKFFFSMITRLLPLNMVRALFESSMEALHRRGPDFITHRTLSKSGEKGPYHVLDPILPMLHEPIGLVIQGPLLLQDDFTVESVRYYSRVKPQVIVIVSTWEGEDAAALERIKALGAEIVLNKKPACPGRSNVNYQIASTRGGIERVIQLGCKFVAKTRADQRLYNLSSFLSLPSLCNYFPVKNLPNQKYRIIGSSKITSKYTPYFFGDLFMFGFVDDMMVFWDADFDIELHRKLVDHGNLTNDLQVAIESSPEHYLIWQYVHKINPNCDFSLTSWWKTLSENLCIIDWATLDIYWPKYNHFQERNDLQYDYHLIPHSIKMVDWICLYNNNDKSTIVPEYLLSLYGDKAILPKRISCSQ